MCTTHSLAATANRTLKALEAASGVPQAQPLSAATQLGIGVPASGRWSGRRDSNSRHPAWKEYSRIRIHIAPIAALGARYFGFW
jgi:hypothetical protein